MWSTVDVVLKGNIHIFWLHTSPSDTNVSLAVGALRWCICVSCLHLQREWNGFPLLSRKVFRLQFWIGYSIPAGPAAFSIQDVFLFTELFLSQPDRTQDLAPASPRPLRWMLAWCCSAFPCVDPVGPDRWIWRYREVNFFHEIWVSLTWIHRSGGCPVTPASKRAEVSASAFPFWALTVNCGEQKEAASSDLQMPWNVNCY